MRALHPLLSDPFVADQIDRALLRHGRGLSADEQEWMRQQLADQIGGDPGLLRLVSAAYPRTVEGSGERVTAWLAALQADATDTRSRGGRE
jgi:hypothetical protein